MTGVKLPLALGFLALVSAYPALGAPPTVAIAPFQSSDTSAATRSKGTEISEFLASFMARSGHVKVVERSQMDRIVREIELGLSGLVEDSTAAEAGRLTGASHIVVGSFRYRGAKWELNARLVETSTGLVTGAVLAEAGREKEAWEEISVELLALLGVKASVKQGYRFQQGVGYGVLTAGVLTAGAGVWSHFQFRSADRKYRTSYSLTDAEFSEVREEAEFHHNARIYLAGTSGLLTLAGIYWVWANRKEWKFESVPPSHSRVVPIWDGSHVGLVWAGSF